MEAKLNKSRVQFVPRMMGVFVFLIIVLGFVAGAARQELALVLTGAVFLALWVYCLVFTLLLALLHRRRARRAFIRVSPGEVTVGETVEAVYAEEEGVAFKGSILQLPGIVVRCRLLLATKDGRCISYDFNPAATGSAVAPGALSATTSAAMPGAHSFLAQKRGAYFSVYDCMRTQRKLGETNTLPKQPPKGFDEFAVFDILGFFRFTYRMSVANDVRLLVSPHAAADPPAVSARAGESTLKPEFSFRRTDNLIDHRPYIPGDDPRRINWKLYGHGRGLSTSGGLFVREGEYEPPPQSNLLILIDTEYDPLLYKEPEARKEVDLLCENALAAALACAESGMEVLVGYSGGVIRNANDPAAMPSAFAWPAAVPLATGGDAALNLPPAPDTYGVLIFALPRSTSEDSAINRFLTNAGNRPVDLLFLYGNAANNAVRGEYSAAAETCAALYNHRSGVRARALGVDQ